MAKQDILNALDRELQQCDDHDIVSVALIRQPDHADALISLHPLSAYMYKDDMRKSFTGFDFPV